MIWSSASIPENSGKTITDVLKRGKVPNVVQMEKQTIQDNTELLPPDKFDNLLGGDVGLPYHQIHFMTGEDLSDTDDHRVLDTYSWIACQLEVGTSFGRRHNQVGLQIQDNFWIPRPRLHGAKYLLFL